MVAPQAASAGVIAPDSPATSNADAATTIYWIALVLTLIVVIGIAAAILRAVASRGDESAEPAHRTRGTAGVQRRVGYGLGAGVLVLFVVAVVFTERSLDVEASEADPISIEVTGQQWLWRYEYPEADDTPDGYNADTPYSYYDLVIPVDTPITLEIGSIDAIHRWWVPALAGAVDAVPGDRHSITFVATEEGTYDGASTEFSGPGYTTMRTQVQVVSQEEYDAFLADRIEGIQAARAAVQEKVEDGSAPGVALEGGEGGDAAAGAGGRRSRSRRRPGRPRRMTPPMQGAARPEIVSEQIPRRQPAWITLVTNPDHKAVGGMYIATSFLFAAIALTELVLMRLQLLLPDNTFIRPDVFDRLFSAYGVTALVLFALPLMIGLFSVVVPLQIGARGMALSRLHHLSYWLYLFGGLTIYLSFLYRPAEAGTISLAPLSSAQFLPGHGQDAWIIGLAIALIGFVLFSVCMIATLRTSRAPGMVWRRTPLFSCAGGVVSWTLLIVGPIMIAALTMLTIDRHFDGVFFNPNEGGSPVLYEHLSSIFLAGAYISVVVAALGAISEIIPTFSRQPQFGHTTIAGSFAALAVLGVLAWMQNMIAGAIPIGFLYFAMLMALAAAIPAGLILFNWFATLSGGALRLRAPLLFALGAIFLTFAGLVGELAQSIPPIGQQLGNTATSWGDTHAALIGAGVLGGFAALHYWFPKLNGTAMGEGLGSASFWALFIGALVMIVPMQMAGVDGQPADVFKFYEDTGSLGLLNAISTVGSLIFAVGFVMAMINAAYSYNGGVAVGPDPWQGSTLEWFTPSPPPVHNFDLVPDVRSNEPLNDIRDAIRRRGTRWTPPPARSAKPEPEPAAAAVEPAATDPAGAEGGEGEDDRPVA